MARRKLDCVKWHFLPPEIYADSSHNRINRNRTGNNRKHYQVTNRDYDNNGNLINDGQHRYQYDARNRLVSVDGVNHYLYNANNQRVKKTNTDTNETTLYAWTSERIFGEYDAQGNPLQETVYLGNTPVGIIKPEGVYRIYADQIHSPRMIIEVTH